MIELPSPRSEEIRREHLRLQQEYQEVCRMRDESMAELALWTRALEQKMSERANWLELKKKRVMVPDGFENPGNDEDEPGPKC